MNRFQYAHVVAYELLRMEQAEDRYNPLYILLHEGKGRQLIKQDRSTPLSKAFIEDFYKPVFDIILGKTENQ